MIEAAEGLWSYFQNNCIVLPSLHLHKCVYLLNRKRKWAFINVGCKNNIQFSAIYVGTVLLFAICIYMTLFIKIHGSLLISSCIYIFFLPADKSLPTLRSNLSVLEVTHVDYVSSCQTKKSSAGS